MLHPDVDRMREEPGPRSVIRRENEMGRKVAKWLPGALTSSVEHELSAWKLRAAESEQHISFSLVTAIEHTLMLFFL